MEDGETMSNEGTGWLTGDILLRATKMRIAVPPSVLIKEIGHLPTESKLAAEGGTQGSIRESYNAEQRRWELFLAIALTKPFLKKRYLSVGMRKGIFAT